MKSSIRAMLVMAMFGVAASSYAATDSSTISPSLLVTTACTITNTVSGQFSSVVTGAVASDPTFVGGNVAVVCATPFVLGANWGTTAEHTTAQRYLTNGGADASADRIAYELLADGVAWGDMGLHAVDPTYTDRTAIAAATGTTDKVFAITGVAHFKGTTLQNAGTYADLVTITIAY